MATRQKKSGSVARATPTPAMNSAPTAGGDGATTKKSATPPGGNLRPTSPRSPTRHSRLVEKAELQNLNDRLACYIDTVRNLETENARLNVEVEETRATVTREVSNIKSMYDHELSDARKLIDETAREQAKLEIDTKRLWEENDDLKTRLEKKTRDLTVAENSVRVLESRCTDLTAKHNTANAERKKAVDDLKDLEKENERLRLQLTDLRRHLEDETLARVDLENTVQSLREELSFKDQVHTKELVENRSRRQVDISEIDGRLAEQYEVLLQQSLQELRDQYEGQMRANRDEIEMLYETKIKNLENAAQRNSHAASVAIEDLRNSRSQHDSLNSRISELEGTNSILHVKIRELEKLLETERSRHAKDLANLEAELSRLRDEMAHQLQEYQDLMDIKVSLDLEIAAYDKLLKGEEYRLNITPSNNASASLLSQSFLSSRGSGLREQPSSAGRGAAKRKRNVVDESEDLNLVDYSYTASAKGEIEISEIDPEGRFVKLHNKSDKEIAVGGWQISRQAGNNETNFKFHRSGKIEGGGVITVWSSDAGVDHEPHKNIVMKTQKWFVGDKMKTRLLNAEGEEVATSECTKHITSSRISKHRELFTTGSGLRRSALGQFGDAGEDIYHQQGDPNSEEKCRIM